MAQKRMHIEVCDALDCTQSFVINTANPIAPGYTFTKGIVIGRGNEDIPRFFACSEAHIVPALNAVLDAQLRS